MRLMDYMDYKIPFGVYVRIIFPVTLTCSCAVAWLLFKVGF